MLRVLLVNNYIIRPSKIGGLKKEISRATGREPHTVHISEILHIDAGEFDAVVLSGGEDPLSSPEVAETYTEAASWIRNTERPMLGICFGHQLIGFAFGGRVARLNRKFEGFYDIDITQHNNIFRGLPDSIKVYKSNQRIVTKTTPDFELLATSVDYEVEAFKHRERPVFGVQFHPENYSEDYAHGRRILENFFESL